MFMFIKTNINKICSNVLAKLKIRDKKILEKHTQYNLIKK